jgi:hypothetical protein
MSPASRQAFRTPTVARKLDAQPNCPVLRAFDPVDVATFPFQPYRKELTYPCANFSLQDDGCVVSCAPVWQRVIRLGTQFEETRKTHPATKRSDFFAACPACELADRI